MRCGRYTSAPWLLKESKLEVQERPQRGSAANRRLRHDGLVPGVLYGRDLEARAIVVPEPELRRALTGEHGAHAILDVVVGGEKKTPSLDSQGLPARPGSRRPSALRSPGRPPRRADSRQRGRDDRGRGAPAARGRHRRSGRCASSPSKRCRPGPRPDRGRHQLARDRRLAASLRSDAAQGSHLPRRCRDADRHRHAAFTRAGGDRGGRSRGGRGGRGRRGRGRRRRRAKAKLLPSRWAGFVGAERSRRWICSSRVWAIPGASTRATATTSASWSPTSLPAATAAAFGTSSPGAWPN